MTQHTNWPCERLSQCKETHQRIKELKAELADVKAQLQFDEDWIKTAAAPEIKSLKQIIADAPHDERCSYVWNYDGETHPPCNCWKAGVKDD